MVCPQTKSEGAEGRGRETEIRPKEKKGIFFYELHFKDFIYLLLLDGMGVPCERVGSV